MELKLLTTLPDGEEVRESHRFSPDNGVENQAVNLYQACASGAAQALEGFGGAVTDAAGYVYSLMDPEQRQFLLDTYFSPEKMNYSLLRVPMDSCDFSLEQYEAVSDPKDEDLKSFSFAGTEKHILPLLEDIRHTAGRPLPLMLSPWSPPGFMKSNGQRTHGGVLKREYWTRWSEYLCRYILEFEARGFPVQRITLQNEPRAVQTWDSCIWTAREQRDFLVEHMAPALSRHGLEHVEVFLWDHNKERVYEWMQEAVDARSAPLTAGAAFHWYSGDHFEALELTRCRFPDKRLILSESCIEFSKFAGEDAAASALRVSHEIIGDLNHGMTAFYDWNLLLDETGGPNYVGNYCLAPFLFYRERRELVPQLLSRYLAHFSRHLVPGSLPVGCSSYCAELEATAWRRPDGSLAAVLLNRSGEGLPVHLRLCGQVSAFRIPARSIATAVISL